MNHEAMNLLVPQNALTEVRNRIPFQWSPLMEHLVIHKLDITLTTTQAGLFQDLNQIDTIIKNSKAYWFRRPTSKTARNIVKAEGMILQLLAAIEENKDPAKILLHIFMALRDTSFNEVGTIELFDSFLIDWQIISAVRCAKGADRTPVLELRRMLSNYLEAFVYKLKMAYETMTIRPEDIKAIQFGQWVTQKSTSLAQIRQQLDVDVEDDLPDDLYKSTEPMHT
jgi:hypothetical protein